MRTIVSSFLVLAALTAESAQTATITLKPTWQGPVDSPPQSLEAKVMADEGRGWASVATRPFMGLVPLVVTVSPGTWWVIVSGPDVWAPPQEVRVTEEGTTLSIKVWPGGSIEGRLRREPSETRPLDLKTRFSPAPGVKGPAAALERCKVEADLKFQCRVPAFELDFRFRAEPYITHYRWGLKVPRGGSAQVGELRLERGASLVGWVATEDGSPLAPTAQATLEPAGLATTIQGDVTPRVVLMQREVPINDRGFFHFDGIAPGEYLVTAKQAPFGPASGPATVLPDAEAELRQPLLLARPETLELAVHPPQTPWGDPWRALLFRSDRRTQRGERVRAETLALDGFLKLEGLPKGQYTLQILAHESQAWAIRGIELGKEPMPITIQIEAVQVEGEVLLGDEPVPARVVFGGRFGGMQVTAEADEKGHFATMLPRPGEWDVDVEAREPRMYVALSKVKVEPRPNEASAFVRLELPDTHLKVEVTDEAGQSVSRALIDIIPSGTTGARPFREWSNASGQAEFHGLKAGGYHVQALGKPDEASDTVPVQVDAGVGTPPVKLVLRRLKRLEVRVLGRGLPIPGAKALLFPVTTTPVSSSFERSDVNGTFELRLPTNAQLLEALVEAPGYAFHLARVPIPPQGALTIELEPQMGTLRLHASVPSDQRRPIAFLVHAGGTLDWHLVGQVSPDSASAGTLGNELLIPNAEPGPWALCPGSADGSIPALSPACVSGVLAPNGVLTLTLE